MNPIVNLKWVKSHKQQKRTIYSVGKIESGLSYNLTKRLAEGISISNKMIQTEISKSKSLKKTIRKLKKDLKKLKLEKDKCNKYKKLKILIKSKKEEYERTKVRQI